MTEAAREQEGAARDAAGRGDADARQLARWDDPATARAYERFCATHDRYRRANEELIAHAALAPGHRVLDVGAGTGRTTEGALAHLGSAGQVLCVEPAAAMAAVGRARVRDARVTWTAELPAPPAAFDRILCGAALWLLTPGAPCDAVLAPLRALLAPGGALVFNIPALYLGEPDTPGGGRDPMLLALWARLLQAGGPLPRVAPAARLPDARTLEAQLRALGLTPEPWRFRLRLTQAAQRDWVKIPPISAGVLTTTDADERARLVDAAAATCDPDAWRWEAWRGWTAWAQ